MKENNNKFLISEKYIESMNSSMNDNIKLYKELKVYIKAQIENPQSLWNIPNNYVAHSRKCDFCSFFYKLKNLKEHELLSAFDVLCKLTFLFRKTDLIMEKDELFDHLSKIQLDPTKDSIEKKLTPLFNKIDSLLDLYQEEYDIEERCKSITKYMIEVYSHRHTYPNLNDVMKLVFVKHYIPHIYICVIFTITQHNIFFY